MTWSIPLGRIAGTAIRVHVTFFLLLLWIAMVAGAQGGPAAAWQGVVFIMLVFVCVVLHEFGHILMARRFGVTTSDITLLPIGGVARLSRMPERAGQELLVALAGPAVNLVIGLLLFAATGTWPSLDAATSGMVGGGGMVVRLASVNLFLLLFNLLPAFPMDGGRVLRALLGYRMGFVRATQVAASVGQGFAFLLGFLGLIGNPILLFIALFVYLGAASEAHMVQLRQVAQGMIAADAMMTRYETLPMLTTLDEAVRAAIRCAQTLFPVMDGQGRLQGVLTQAALINHLQIDGPGAVVADAMTPAIPAIHPYQPLSEALRLLQEGNLPAVAVVDAGDRLVGLITSETIGELMLTHGIRVTQGRRAADSDRPPTDRAAA
ncbi:site-2 protease family protein [Gluconacetobacter diazotrophicus]|uniref:Zinc metalloprotease n=1 Tax=Gluconacetobacter diazotrophicus (strain ATCC 49037 / DSM 5601 / CCUG 37298 / CIP 103539 / LMG 7603 / PAl5) TaxID=272568 RepID=A9HLL4_GLUDA|nr:site-2 protease family protein [Gluconacetobacter diazotrophicus]CAP56183.1 putative peptidase protein [Gluconacetobacter diazotrophicus PA1 5]